MGMLNARDAQADLTGSHGDSRFVAPAASPAERMQRNSIDRHAGSRSAAPPATVVRARVAGGCEATRCGGVKNRTGRTMHVTLELGKGGHLCAVWNNGGGWKPWKPKFERVSCTHRTVGNGWWSGNFSGQDIDAFTFASEGYHLRWGRLGRWGWKTKGVWTKIPTGSAADCGIGARKEIWCTVLVQLP